MGHTYRQTVIINALCPTLRGGRTKRHKDTTHVPGKLCSECLLILTRGDRCTAVFSDRDVGDGG